MLLKIDLHVHSDRSPDGRSSLPKLISAAKAKGLDGFALADHDLLSQPMEVDDFLIIPACECSTKDGHIVGLFLSELPRCLKSFAYPIFCKPPFRLSAFNDGTSAAI